MGQFRITVVGVGGHGADRAKVSGEIVDFSSSGDKSPDALAKALADELKATGCSLTEATITHWPGTPSQVLDDLLSGKRAGQF